MEKLAMLTGQIVQPRQFAWLSGAIVAPVAALLLSEIPLTMARPRTEPTRDARACRQGVATSSRSGSWRCRGPASLLSSRRPAKAISEYSNVTENI
jgi:hypothetical protein